MTLARSGRVIRRISQIDSARVPPTSSAASSSVYRRAPSASDWTPLARACNAWVWRSSTRFIRSILAVIFSYQTAESTPKPPVDALASPTCSMAATSATTGDFIVSW